MRMIRLTDLLINVKLTDIPYDQLNQTSIYQSMIYVFKCRFIELVQGLPLISQVSVWSIFSSWSLLGSSISIARSVAVA